MSPSINPSSLSLPDAWPRRVRSAVVHAVAMAGTSLVLARAASENAYDMKVRLRADVARLQAEIALLK